MLLLVGAQVLEEPRCRDFRIEITLEDGGTRRDACSIHGAGWVKPANFCDSCHREATQSVLQRKERGSGTGNSASVKRFGKSLSR